MNRCNFTLCGTCDNRVRPWNQLLFAGWWSLVYHFGSTSVRVFCLSLSPGSGRRIRGEHPVRAIGEISPVPSDYGASLARMMIEFLRGISVVIINNKMTWQKGATTKLSRTRNTGIKHGVLGMPANTRSIAEITLSLL